MKFMSIKWEKQLSILTCSIFGIFIDMFSLNIITGFTKTF